MEVTRKIWTKHYRKQLVYNKPNQTISRRHHRTRKCSASDRSVVMVLSDTGRPVRRGDAVGAQVAGVDSPLADPSGGVSINGTPPDLRLVARSWILDENHSWISHGEAMPQ